MPVEFDKHLEHLLKGAEDAAQKCGIFQKRGVHHGYYTVEEALKLAVAVWKVEAKR